MAGALACLVSCASISGLDSIQECDDCLDDAGRTQDGTVGADAGGDASSAGEAAPDTSTAETSPADTGSGADTGRADAPQDATDGAAQDATDAGATTDSGDSGDGSSDAGPDTGADASEAGPCNPSTCLGGCCQGVNCIAGTADNACGQTGGACLNCTALGDTCVGGACQAPSSNCPNTCSGCCDTNGACHATASAQYCPTSDGGTFKAGLGCENCVAEGYPFCIKDFVVYVCSPIP